MTSSALRGGAVSGDAATGRCSARCGQHPGSQQPLPLSARYRTTAGRARTRYGQGHYLRRPGPLAGLPATFGVVTTHAGATGR